MSSVCLIEVGKYHGIVLENDRVLSDININIPTQFERSHVQTPSIPMNG